jgi:hypothetical protein
MRTIARSTVRFLWWRCGSLCLSSRILVLWLSSFPVDPFRCMHADITPPTSIEASGSEYGDGELDVAAFGAFLFHLTYSRYFLEASNATDGVV